MSMVALRPASDPAAYVVMGVSGCGKTSVGRAVAEALGLPFVEGDGLHPESNIAKMSRGVPLTDEDRFPWLDRIGSEIAGSLDHDKGIVVSCSALRIIYRDRLRTFSKGRLTFLFLEGSEETLAARLASRKGHFMPASLLKSQFATLENPRGEDDVITIDISGTSAEVIEMALEELAAYVR